MMTQTFLMNLETKMKTEQEQILLVVEEIMEGLTLQVQQIIEMINKMVGNQEFKPNQEILEIIARVVDLEEAMSEVCTTLYTSSQKSSVSYKQK